MVQFCYLRLYLGIDIVSQYCLPSFVAMECKDWNFNRPTTRYRTYSTQITKRLIQLIKVTKKVTLKQFMAGKAWPGWEDQYEIMTGAFGSMRRVKMVIRLPGGTTWVNFCWVCAAGLSEPLPHNSLFYGQLYIPS